MNLMLLKVRLGVFMQDRNSGNKSASYSDSLNSEVAEGHFLKMLYEPVTLVAIK